MVRVDRASRLIAAAPAQIFAALTDPIALVEWLPPDGMSGRVDAFDPRPGGRVRLALTYGDSARAPGKTTPATDVIDGRVVEVAPDARLSYAVTFVTDDTGLAGEMIMTWSLTPVGDGTRVDVAAEGVPAGIDPGDHRRGMASSLANLAAYLDVPRRRTGR